MAQNYLYRKNIHLDSSGTEILIPISFSTTVHGKLPLVFYTNTELVQVKVDSSQLVIFHVYNYSKENIDFFIGYQIFPYALTSYIIKLQCFCYEHILILKDSNLVLPVLFFIDQEILNHFSEFNDNQFSCLNFYYHIYRADDLFDSYLGK